MFASSKYIAGMGFFSQLTDFFFFFIFCAKRFRAWAQSNYKFYFFPLVLLGGLFFCSSTRVKISLTLATAILSGAADVTK